MEAAPTVGDRYCQERKMLRAPAQDAGEGAQA